MTGKSESPYKIRSDDPNDLMFECNRIFALISDRLDTIQGFRGYPVIYNKTVTEYDIIIDSNTTGIIFKDDASPANYWRVTIDSSGTLTKTKLGPTYP